MELFVIQCTTCRARLKVHDPALIGDIVECPKCGSFVEVAAPPGWQPPAAVAASATSAAPGKAPSASGSSIILPARTKRSAAAAAVGAVPPPPPPPLPGSGKTVAGATAANEPVKPAPAAGRSAASGAGVRAGQNAGAKSGAAAAAKSGAAPAAPQAAALVVPDPDGDGWLVSAASALGGHWRLAAGVLTGCVLIAAGAWLALGRQAADPLATASDGLPVSVADTSHTGDEPATESATSTATSGADAPAAASDAGAPDDAAHFAAGETGDAEAQTVHDAAAPVAEREAAADAAAPGDALAAPALPSDPRDPIARALASDPGPQEVTAPTTIPRLPGEEDPVDEPADAATDAASGAASSTAASSGRPSTDTTSGGTTAETDAPAEEAFDPAKQARLVGHLQDKLPAIEFKDVPLANFVAFLSDYSTVPMVIDPEALAELARSGKTKVTVKSAGGTVEQMLRSCLSRPGLTFHVEPGRVLITAGGAKR